MAIAILGQVVGAAEGVLHLVNGQQQKAELQLVNNQEPSSPQQLVVHTDDHSATRRVVSVLDTLAGNGSLGSALTALKPELAELGDLSEDDKDLVNWIKVYQHIKADLADNGQLDQLPSHLAEVAGALHVKDVAIGWGSNLLARLKGLVGGK